MTTKKYQDWEKNLKELNNTCADINEKISHIIEQTREIYFALSSLDSIGQYSNKESDSYCNNGSECSE
jgi:hypothetical protein